MVMSGGIVTPPDRRPEAERNQPKVSAKTYEDVDTLREKENVPILVSRDIPARTENSDPQAKDGKTPEDA